MLQVNMRWKALAEIYKMHSLLCTVLVGTKLIFCWKIALKNLPNVAKFVKFSIFVPIFIGISLDLVESKKYQIFAENLKLCAI